MQHSLNRTLGLLLLMAMPLAGQTSLRAEAVVAPDSMVLGERGLYAVVVEVSGMNEAPPTPEPPPGNGYRLRFLRSKKTGDSTRIEMIGGRRRRSVSSTYQFIWDVDAQQAGRFTIAAFDYEVGERKARVPAVSVDVTLEAAGNEFVELRIRVSPERPYVNQQMTVSVDVVSAKPFVSRSGEAEIPWAASPNGLFGLPRPAQKRGEQRFAMNINGELDGLPIFRNPDVAGGEVLRLERTFYPLAPGRIVVPETRFSAEIATSVKTDIFRRRVVDKKAKVVLVGEEVAFEVRDAPLAGRPEGYQGVIGDFAVELNYGKTEIRAGDGVTLSLKLTGDGELQSVPLPNLVGFDDFDVYSPERSVSDAASGKRQLEISWLLVPKRAEVEELPRFDFAWFSPTNERFETVSAGPESLKIMGERRDEGIFGGASTGRAASEIRTLAEGIRPLMQEQRGLRKRSEGVSLWLATLLLLAPMISFGLLVGSQRRRRRLAGDSSLLRKKRASRQAEQRLTEARALLDASGDFHGKLQKSLCSFIADKLSLPPASVSAATVDDYLAPVSIPEEERRRVVDCLRDLDARRYGGADADAERRREALTEVESIIHLLDRAISS